MLAIIFVRNAGDKSYQYFVREWRRMLTIMISRNANHYTFQKCWREMLATIIFRNAGEEC